MTAAESMLSKRKALRMSAALFLVKKQFRLYKIIGNAKKRLFPTKRIKISRQGLIRVREFPFRKLRQMNLP